MVYRLPPFKFVHNRTTRQTARYIINELPKTYNDHVYPQIPFLVRSRKYKIKCGYENNPSGQLFNLTYPVTQLFKDERIVLNYNKAAEIRPQVERIIVEAMKHGDRHRPTMDLANFWLRDKSMIHKLFKVFVPRYKDYSSAFTAVHLLGGNYDVGALTYTERQSFKGHFYKMGEACLEMRGNPLPPVIKPRLDRPNLLTNLLIDGAREEAMQRRQEPQQQPLETS